MWVPFRFVHRMYKRKAYMENKEFENDEFEENEAGMIIRADSIEIIEEYEEAKGARSADAETDEEEEEKPKKSPMREVLEWVVCIALALVLTFLIKGFLFDFVVVDGQSMQHTLMHGERLVLRKIGYSEPERGDVIVLDANFKAREAYFQQRRDMGEDFGAFDEFWAVYMQRGRAKSLGINKLYYVKRVIAVEGDVIDIDPIAGTVTVNGEVLDEPYLDENMITPLGYGMQYPYTVEAGHVFVMGDNRTNSKDSRYADVGAVPEEAVTGKVGFRIWPLNKLGIVDDAK